MIDNNPAFVASKAEICCCAASGAYGFDMTFPLVFPESPYEDTAWLVLNLKSCQD